MARKKKQKKDFSVLFYIIGFVVVASFMLFLMFSSVDRNTVVNEQPQNERVAQTQPQEQQIQQSKPQIKEPTKVANISDFEEFKYKITYTFDVRGTIKNAIFRIPTPSTENEKQYIVSSNISVKPTKTYYDGATSFAEFNFPELTTQKLVIEQYGQAKVRTYDLKTAKLINKNPNPETDLSKYLQEEQYIEVSDPLVKSYAAKIKGETREEIIQNIYEFTQKHLRYKNLQGVSGAKKALKQRVGECSEYSAIMVALCRAKGIPARVVIGNIAREQNTKHNWVEVYFDEYGWVNFDPTTMPTVVNVYKNGKLVKKEKILDSNSAIVKYIASGKNLFSPYIFKYQGDSKNNGKATLMETIVIEKAK